MIWENKSVPFFLFRHRSTLSLISFLASLVGVAHVNVAIAEIPSCQSTQRSEALALYKKGDQAHFDGDYEQAFRLYLSAARKGNAFSMHNVAFYLAKGLVKGDLIDAYAWSRASVTYHSGDLPRHFLELNDALRKRLSDAADIAKAETRYNRIRNMVDTNTCKSQK